jgi:acyl dehydratase
VRRLVLVGDELPALRRIVTRADLKAYADASGDQNPLHRDDEVARAAGFPTIIAHGMFTMGHLAACISEWAGDPAAVLSLSANFRAPALEGDEISAGGRVVAVDEASGIVTLETWVTVDREGGTLWPIKRGQARVRLA